MQCIKVEALQFAIDAVGVRSEIIRNSEDGLLQCCKEFTRRRRVNLIDVYLFLIQLVPADD